MIPPQRKILLQNKGKNEDFIENLLLDAQQWNDFRTLLQVHMRTARDLLQDFQERRFISEEVTDWEKRQKKEKDPISEPPETINDGKPKTMVDQSSQTTDDSKAATAIDELSKIIQRMESEVQEEISKLDKKTNEMIELVST